MICHSLARSHTTITIGELEAFPPQLRAAKASSRAAGTSLVTLLHPTRAPTSALAAKLRAEHALAANVNSYV